MQGSQSQLCLQDEIFTFPWTIGTHERHIVPDDQRSTVGGESMNSLTFLKIYFNIEKVFFLYYELSRRILWLLPVGHRSKLYGAKMNSKKLQLPPESWIHYLPQSLTHVTEILDSDSRECFLPDHSHLHRKSSIIPGTFEPILENFYPESPTLDPVTKVKYNMRKYPALNPLSPPKS